MKQPLTDLYIIVDWCNNLLFNGKEFQTFEDGWDFIYEMVKDEDNAYDDLYVIAKSHLFYKGD